MLTTFILFMVNCNSHLLRHALFVMVNETANPHCVMGSWTAQLTVSQDANVI